MEDIEFSIPYAVFVLRSFLEGNRIDRDDFLIIKAHCWVNPLVSLEVAQALSLTQQELEVILEAAHGMPVH